MAAQEAQFRIGELSRRSGVSDHTLRAWERRYGLLRPRRTDGGFRLYSEDDERRVRRMLELLATGVSPAQAAGVVLGEDELREVEQTPAADLPQALESALEAMDEVTAGEILDRLFSELTPETVMRGVLVPCLQRLGERWADGSLSVSQEHFATSVVRGRLVGLARGWGSGLGPHALLACPSGEQHDIGLLMFGIALHRGGWRIGFFGADTPLPDLLPVVRGAEPDLVVLTASDARHFTACRSELEQLAAAAPVLLGGQGAQALAEETDGLPAGCMVLSGDPVTAAHRLTTRPLLLDAPAREVSPAG